MIVLHEVIPHHHHEHMANESSLHQHDETGHHHHHNTHDHHDLPENHEKNIPTENQHDHDFPQHYHHFATDDFDLVRVANHIESSNLQPLVFVLTESITKQFLRPPNITYQDDNLSFLINPLFRPGAIALRAPPCFV